MIQFESLSATSQEKKKKENNPETNYLILWMNYRL